MQNWRRIGQAGGLDQHPIEIGDDLFLALHDQAFQRIEQIATHRATKATAVQQNGFLIDLADQRVVDADFTEFIDDHRDPVHVRVLDQFAQQGRLTGAEKAGDHRNGQPVMG